MPRVLLASIPLRLVLPVDRAKAAAEGVTKLVFRTLPSVNKLEIREMLTQLYGLPVAGVATANCEGKKKRSKGGFFRQPDFKLAYVTLKKAVTIPAPLPPPPDAKDAKKAPA